MPAAKDPFDDLLSLEDGFYKEGYNLGVSEGNHAGLVEGRLFGLEKGFEKYAAMGILHGRATVWAGRLPERSSDDDAPNMQDHKSDAPAAFDSSILQEQRRESGPVREKTCIPRLQGSTRLETHVRTLYALAEPGSLSIKNSEDSVSDFDDRLRRAEGKVKVIEKLTGESSYGETTNKPPQAGYKPIPFDMTSRKGDNSSIEDISSLHARH